MTSGSFTDTYRPTSLPPQHSTMRAFTLGSNAAALIGLLVSNPGAEPVALTPSGYHPTSKIHKVPAGGHIAHVGNNIHLINANGAVIHIAAPSTEKTLEAPHSGWACDVSWGNDEKSPIGSFATTWTVPPAPMTWDNQTVFLSNGLAPTTGAAILQPTLQYGHSAAGGGPYWSVASFYVAFDNQYFTEAVRVNSGDTLHGIMELTGVSAATDKCNYKAEFSDISGTVLTVEGVEELTSASESLTVLRLDGSREYPVGSTVFSHIDLKLLDGKTPNLKWTPRNRGGDNPVITVDVDGATNGKVTIRYPIAG
ncbi:hypothetical protein FB451DRAFT_61217 [Mycena latifolia]|nr:hypothetical protein FB451DRAFT_61217 [Mycena latifolia]